MVSIKCRNAIKFNSNLFKLPFTTIVDFNNVGNINNAVHINPFKLLLRNLIEYV